MPDRDDPGRLLYPGFTGRIMVDTWRGKVRVRKWPDKRGRPKSEAVRKQNDWFRQANRLASRAPPSQMRSAIEITKNSGLYPRDILMRMMAGNLGDIPLSDGRILTKATKRIDPVSFQGAIQNNTVAQPITANVTTNLLWQLPVFDPLGFWSIAAPNRLTIPENISMIRIDAGARITNGGVGILRVIIRHNGSDIPRGTSGNATHAGTTVSTGPIPVTPGDYFELWLNTNRTGSTYIGPTTYLSATILTAT